MRRNTQRRKRKPSGPPIACFGALLLGTVSLNEFRTGNAVQALNLVAAHGIHFAVRELHFTVPPARKMYLA